MKGYEITDEDKTAGGFLIFCIAVLLAVVLYAADCFTATSSTVVRTGEVVKLLYYT